jgi:transposase
MPKASSNIVATGGWFNLYDSRSRARAPRGKRAYGKVPKNRGKNTTLIASITLEGAMGESMSVEGATDSLAFEAYDVEHFLAPTLKKGQVVLDGLGAHRTEKVKELIEARGAELVFLPSYSPEMNPIEEAFSKIKHLVRKVGLYLARLLSRHHPRLLLSSLVFFYNEEAQ